MISFTNLNSSRSLVFAWCPGCEWSDPFVVLDSGDMSRHGNCVPYSWWSGTISMEFSYQRCPYIFKPQLVFRLLLQLSHISCIWCSLSLPLSLSLSPLSLSLSISLSLCHSLFLCFFITDVLCHCLVGVSFSCFNTLVFLIHQHVNVLTPPLLVLIVLHKKTVSWCTFDIAYLAHVLAR